MSTEIIKFEIRRQHKTDEPRVADTEIADRLGYPRVTEFRRLIRKHAKTLKQFSVLAESAQTSTSLGGRPRTAYWLTETQAIYIVSQSGMPIATQIAVGVVKAFVARKRNEIAGTQNCDHCDGNCAAPIRRIIRRLSQRKPADVQGLYFPSHPKLG